MLKKNFAEKNIYAGKYKIRQNTRSKQGPGKVKVRWRQSKHNLDLNYNLMGFDTIEINLVKCTFKISNYQFVYAISCIGYGMCFFPKLWTVLRWCIECQYVKLVLPGFSDIKIFQERYC